MLGDGAEDFQVLVAVEEHVVQHKLLELFAVGQGQCKVGTIEAMSAHLKPTHSDQHVRAQERVPTFAQAARAGYLRGIHAHNARPH